MTPTAEVFERLLIQPVGAKLHCRDRRHADGVDLQHVQHIINFRSWAKRLWCSVIKSASDYHARSSADPCYAANVRRPVLTVRPRYSTMGFRGTGRPSCNAFLTPTVGCMTHTSTNPANAPMAVCCHGDRDSPLLAGIVLFKCSTCCMGDQKLAGDASQHHFDLGSRSGARQIRKCDVAVKNATGRRAY